MLGGLFGFRLDVELAFEPDRFLVIHRHLQEGAQVIHLALEVGVEQRAVAFASAPENVAFTLEFVCHFDRFLHLGGGVGKHIRIRARGRAHRVARMNKEAGRAPQQPDPGPLLFPFQDFHDGIQVLVGLPQGRSFRRHVAVVERVERRPELLHEFKGHPHACLSHLQRVGAVFPGPEGRPGPKHIPQLPADRVPIGHRKPQMILHRLPVHHLIGVVMLERERVPGLGAFKLDATDFWEEFFGYAFHINEFRMSKLWVAA